MPLHRITAVFQALEALGFQFDTEPSSRGYWIICTQAPERVTA